MTLYRNPCLPECYWFVCVVCRKDWGGSSSRRGNPAVGSRRRRSRRHPAFSSSGRSHPEVCRPRRSRRRCPRRQPQARLQPLGIVTTPAASRRILLHVYHTPHTPTCIIYQSCSIKSLRWNRVFILLLSTNKTSPYRKVVWEVRGCGYHFRRGYKKWWPNSPFLTIHLEKKVETQTISSTVTFKTILKYFIKMDFKKIKFNYK